MFGNQEELHKPLPNVMMINLVGSNYLHEIITTNISESIDGAYSGRLKIIGLVSIDQLPFKKPPPHESEISFGLINSNWIKKVTSMKPSTVILIYDTRTKLESITWKDYENSIFIDIQKVKKLDQNTNILSFIFTSNPNFTFDTVNEDRERIYNIKKALDGKNLFYIPNVDIVKTSEFKKKISNHILKLCLNYYRTLKKSLKVKRTISENFKEKLIKYNIKLGVISMMKNKKPSLKYFEEAYNYLSSGFDIKNYYYGSTNAKENYWEIKNVGDWLFFKIFHIYENKDPINLQNLCSMFNFHMNNFSKEEFLEKGEKMFVVEFFWKVLRYEMFSRFFEDNYSFSSSSMASTTSLSVSFPGYYHMLTVFNVTRLIKLINAVGIDTFLTNTNATSVTLFSGKVVAIENLKTVQNKFFGKPPKYYIQVDPLTVKEIGYDENIYLKSFITCNGISIKNLQEKSSEMANRAIKSYGNLFKTGSFFKDTGVKFYLSVINGANALNTDQANTNELKMLYRNLISAPNLPKFPQLYLSFIEKYNGTILNASVPLIADDYIQLMENLFSIANVRALTLKEEELFFDLIYSESPAIKQKFTLNADNITSNYSTNEVSTTCLNKIIGFDYSIIGGNTTPKIFDMVEYQFHFNSFFVSNFLKIKNVSFIFNNSERNKIFLNGDDSVYELSSTKDLTLCYKIFVKENDNFLRLKFVRIELLPYKDNNICLEILVKSEQEKILNVKPAITQVLEFKYPRFIKVGVGELYNLECEVSKNPNANVDVDNVKIRFEIENERGENNILLKPRGAKSLPANPSVESLGNSKMSGDFPLTEAPLPVVSHEFLLKNQEGKIITQHISIEIPLSHVANWENPVKCNCLIKFKEKGNYVVNFEAEYKILKNEIFEDSASLTSSGKINFEVVPPFSIKFDLFADSYMSLQKQKVFSNNRAIKLNLILANNLDVDVHISDLISKSASSGIHLNSSLNVILQKFQRHPITTILKASEYIIPFEILFTEEFSGCLGKTSVMWSTTGLNLFKDNIIPKDTISSLVNTNEFVMPDVNVKNFDVALSYEIPKTLIPKEDFEFVIKIKNNSDEFKRIIFLIDTQTNFIISGSLKKKMLLNPDEMKDLTLTLSPICYGKNKLPPFKIMEFPLANNNYDSKIYSIYYIPEYIQIDA